MLRTHEVHGNWVRERRFPSETRDMRLTAHTACLRAMTSTSFQHELLFARATLSANSCRDRRVAEYHASSERAAERTVKPQSDCTCPCSCQRDQFCLCNGTCRTRRRLSKSCCDSQCEAARNPQHTAELLEPWRRVQQMGATLCHSAAPSRSAWADVDRGGSSSFEFWTR